jgi:hypothetical protein
MQVLQRRGILQPFDRLPLPPHRRARLLGRILALRDGDYYVQIREQAAINSAQETFLGFIWALLVAFTESCFVMMPPSVPPVYTEGHLRSMCLSTVATGLIGMLICSLGGEGAAFPRKWMTVAAKGHRMILFDKLGFSFNSPRAAFIGIRYSDWVITISQKPQGFQVINNCFLRLMALTKGPFAALDGRSVGRRTLA